MDFELMINSFPKLLNAAGITLKLLSVSLIVGLVIGLFFASLMALSFGLAQVYSRELRNLDTSLLNTFVGLIGFIILLIISYIQFSRST